jgi:uncharacterized membrane protein YfcA
VAVSAQAALLEVAAGTLIGLVAFGLVAGIGITAVGPGGVLVTVGLFVLTDLSPAAVAGTAIVTHVANGALGTAAYWRSGQLRRPPTRRAAGVLAAAALVGTPLGVLVNGAVSGPAFAVLLAAVAATGILVLVRERRVGPVSRHPSTGAVAVVGTVVAAASGLFGIGGPMLSVPLLVVCGMPVLDALGAAQAQSIVIASVGTVGYAAQGAIDWPLAVVVGVPELVGVLIGWRIAHAVPTHRLRLALAAALICLAPYLALHG